MVYFFFLVTFLNTIHPEYVGKPEVFISHPWGNRISRLITSLISFDETLFFALFPPVLKVDSQSVISLSNSILYYRIYFDKHDMGE